MKTKNFAAMLLKEIKESEIPVTGTDNLQTDKGLFGLKLSDKSQFLIKITEREAMQEAALLEMEETEDKLHEIYEKYTNNWEYDELLRTDDFDIDWLVGNIDDKNYRRLEDYLMYYCSRHDELMFRLGFKYAWSLFTECRKVFNAGSRKSGLTGKEGNRKQSKMKNISESAFRGLLENCCGIICTEEGPIVCLEEGPIVCLEEET